MQNYLKNFLACLKKTRLFLVIWGGVVLPILHLQGQDSVRNIFKEKGRWGYLDDHENIVIPAKFENVFPFSHNRATVKRRGRWGQIDLQGKRIIPIRYDDPYFYADEKGLILVSRRKKWGAIDTMGCVAIPLQYDRIYPFWSGLARVEKTGKMGFLNATGAIVIPLVFDSLTPVYAGNTLLGQIDHKWGVLNTSGKYLTEIKFDSLEQTSAPSIFLAFLSGKPGYVDTLGNEIFTWKKDLLPPPDDFQNFSELITAIHQLEQCNEIKKIQKETALEIALNEGFKTTEEGVLQWGCQLVMHESVCCWRIISVTASTTREGDCRFTNGCTAVLTRTLWVESQSGKIIQSETRRKLYPNYE
ncbi:MAG: WG repeat-containing protein [Bacteroidia bacterium]|nr:WG repeat-containing protein [Bacteroidia bacterium]